jgi:hypothetical protein
MSEYDGEVIKLLTQILDELRRIRISLDDRDRIQQEENEDLLKRTKRRIVVPRPSKCQAPWRCMPLLAQFSV